MTEHDHPDPDTLTFGCQACVERIREERWRSAPEARLTFRAVVPDYVTTDKDGKRIEWTFFLVARVPLDVTDDELEDADGRFDIGAAMFEMLPNADTFTDQQLVDIFATALVRVVKVARLEAAPAVDQPPLFGEAS